MPCLSGYENDPPDRTHERQLEVKVASLEAMLCGVTHVLERDGTLQGILKDVDWDEAGTTHSAFSSWWHDHKVQDAQRRITEDAKKLPPGRYDLKQLVQWKGLEWIVTAVGMTNNVIKVRLVTMGDGPIKSESVEVRKK